MRSTDFMHGKREQDRQRRVRRENEVDVAQGVESRGPGSGEETGSARKIEEARLPISLTKPPDEPSHRHWQGKRQGSEQIEAPEPPDKLQCERMLLRHVQ